MGALLLMLLGANVPCVGWSRGGMNNVRLRSVTKNNVGGGGDKAIATPPGDSNAAVVDHNKDNNDAGNSERQLRSEWLVGV